MIGILLLWPWLPKEYGEEIPPGGEGPFDFIVSDSAYVPPSGNGVNFEVE